MRAYKSSKCTQLDTLSFAPETGLLDRSTIPSSMRLAVTSTLVNQENCLQCHSKCDCAMSREVRVGKMEGQAQEARGVKERTET